MFVRCVQCGSPDNSIEGTFSFSFELPRYITSPRPAPQRQVTPRPNPILLALEWDKALKDGLVPNRATLARLKGLSRARITQVLDLLTLSPDVIARLSRPGDGISTRFLLRLLNVPTKDQLNELDLYMLQKSNTVKKTAVTIP